LPLDEILATPHTTTKNKSVSIGVWQGLVNNDPDVDAIYRLTVNKKIDFEHENPVVLDNGIYCPFNSQNTFWQKDVFKYLYLPTSVTFRFTDILRGYIAQFLMWQNDYHLGFLPPNVCQIRNEHNIMKDFSDEVVCYTQIKKIVDLFEQTDIVKLYSDLHNNSIIDTNDFYAAADWVEEIDA